MCVYIKLFTGSVYISYGISDTLVMYLLRHCMGYLGSFRSQCARGARYLWPRLGGPALTLGLIAVIGLPDESLLGIPNPPALLLLAVVYSAFSGGAIPGLFSALFAWFHFAYFFSLPDQPFHYNDENLRRVVVWAVATPAMALMVGILKKRAMHAFEVDKTNAVLQAQLAERAQAESALRTAHEALHEREGRIRRLVESNIIGVFFWELDGGIVDANDAFLHIARCTREELQAGKLRWTDLTPDEYRGADERAIGELNRTGRCTPYEKEFARSCGERIPVLVGGAFLEGSQRIGVAFVLDLSERKRAEERIRHMAHHDPLTGLPNRVLLFDRVSQAIAQARRHGYKVALLFVDLDHFKRINDSLGHQVGDRLLCEVALRLGCCVRCEDTVARLGGDEFVLSLPSIGSDEDARQAAQKVLDILTQPFNVGDQELHVGSSIGISVYPDDGADASALLRAADTAMYHAKDKGRGNCQFFTLELNVAAQQRLALEGQLRQAWERGEFELHYQPQVEIDSGRIVAVEALLRWQQPGRGAASCAEFIGIAEERGLILPIGEWALRVACEQLRCWHEAGYPALRMAVNVSARQFFQPRFDDVVERILEQTGVIPTALDLEITETTLMQPNEDNLETLQRLNDIGVQLAVDDFGMGYSSLAYLQRFPIRALKIDRAFVGGIGQNPHDAALVTAIVVIARSLGLHVVAEGVESAEQSRFILAQGCRLGQGFYYHKPMPGEALTELLGRQAHSDSATCTKSVAKP